MNTKIKNSKSREKKQIIINIMIIFITTIKKTHFKVHLWFDMVPCLWVVEQVQYSRGEGFI